MFDWLSISTDMLHTSQAIVAFFNDKNITLEKKISQYGELLEHEKQSGEYKGIKFSIWPKRTKIYFSPHKLYNEINGIRNHRHQAMNHDTFTYEKLCFIIDWLRTNFSVQPEECFLHQIEFGFNLTDLDIDTSCILDFLIGYKGKRFSPINVIGRGRGEQIIYNDYYRIKLYDKALQNDINYSILRVEFKAKKMQPLSGIFDKRPTLSLLLVPGVWQLCKDFLLKHIDLCLIGDKFEIAMSDTKKLKLSYWSSPIEWSKMRADTRCKQKRKFEKFINQNGTLQVKSRIVNAVHLEFNKMIQNKSAMNLPNK